MNKLFKAILLICLLGLTFATAAATNDVPTSAVTAVKADAEKEGVYEYLPKRKDVDAIVRAVYDTISHADKDLKKKLAEPLSLILVGICYGHDITAEH